jgi:hypothetical protein
VVDPIVKARTIIATTLKSVRLRLQPSNLESHQVTERNPDINANAGKLQALIGHLAAVALSVLNK